MLLLANSAVGLVHHLKHACSCNLLYTAYLEPEGCVGQVWHYKLLGCAFAVLFDSDVHGRTTNEEAW